MDETIRKRIDEESDNIAVDVLHSDGWIEVFQLCTDDEADEAIKDLLRWKAGG